MERADIRHIMLVYAAVAGAWILGSDLLVFSAHAAPFSVREHVGETGKGLAFVAVTAIGLGALLTRRADLFRRDLAVSQAARDAAAAHLDLVLSANPAVVWGADVSRGLEPTYLGANARTLFGVPAQAFEDDPGYFDEHLHPDDRDGVARALAQLLDEGEAVHEFRFRHAAGHLVWIRAVGRLLRDAEGRPRTIVGALTDETPRRRAEAAGRATEHRYRLLFEANPLPMLLVDVDGRRFLEANGAAVAQYGWSREELLARWLHDLDPTGRSCAAFHGERVDQVVETRHVRSDGTVFDVELIGHPVEVDGRRAVLAMVQDVSARVAADRQLAEHVARLQRSITGTVDAVSRLVELRDPYTAGHQRRVGELGAAIARELGLDEDVQRGLRIAGSLHDVGKVIVPAEILTRGRRLTPVEAELVKEHAAFGYDVLKTVEFPWPVAEVARQHHERMDGSGYPRGLAGEAILLEARIIAVADVVDAMSGHRPYRPALGLDAALAEIEGGAGRIYDADVVAACARVLRRGLPLVD